MKKIRYKSILLILCLSMFSSALTFGFVKAELTQASSVNLTETIVVFDHESHNRQNPAIATITIQNMPIESVIMELEARNNDRDWWRAIYFDVDGYLDGVVGTPPGVGGLILTWREYLFNVRGPGVLYNIGSPDGPNQKSFMIDMSNEAYFATGVNYEKYYHNFIPQNPSQTVGYFSPGQHIITTFVTSPATAENSWVTVKLHITYRYIPATVDFDPDTLNRKSQGKWVTVYIGLPEGYDAEDVDITTIMLNGVVPAEPKPTGIDEDGILMIKFDRQVVKSLLEPGENVEISITGTVNGMEFEGTDTIRVIH